MVFTLLSEDGQNSSAIEVECSWPCPACISHNM